MLDEDGDLGVAHARAGAGDKLVFLLGAPGLDHVEVGGGQQDQQIEAVKQRLIGAGQGAIDGAPPAAVEVALALQVVDGGQEVQRRLGPGADAPTFEQHHIERPCHLIPAGGRAALIGGLVKAGEGNGSWPGEPVQDGAGQRHIVGAGRAANRQQRVGLVGQPLARLAAQIDIVEGQDSAGKTALAEQARGHGADRGLAGTLGAAEADDGARAFGVAQRDGPIRQRAADRIDGRQKRRWQVLVAEEILEKVLAHAKVAKASRPCRRSAIRSSGSSRPTCRRMSGPP